MKIAKQTFCFLLTMVLLFLSCSKQEEYVVEPIFSPGTPEFIYTYNAYNNYRAYKDYITEHKGAKGSLEMLKREISNKLKNNILKSNEDKNIAGFVNWLDSNRKWDAITFYIALFSTENNEDIRERFHSKLKTELIQMINQYTDETGKEIDWRILLAKLIVLDNWEKHSHPELYVLFEVYLYNRNIELQMRKYMEAYMLPYYTEHKTSIYMVEILQSFTTDTTSTAKFLLEIHYEKLRSQAKNDKIMKTLALLAECYQEQDYFLNIRRKEYRNTTAKERDRFFKLVHKLENMGIKNFPWKNKLVTHKKVKKSISPIDLSGTIVYAVQNLLRTGATPDISGK